MLVHSWCRRCCRAPICGCSAARPPPRHTSRHHRDTVTRSPREHPPPAPPHHPTSSPAHAPRPPAHPRRPRRRRRPAARRTTLAHRRPGPHAAARSRRVGRRRRDPGLRCARRRRRARDHAAGRLDPLAAAEHLHAQRAPRPPRRPGPRRHGPRDDARRRRRLPGDVRRRGPRDPDGAVQRQGLGLVHAHRPGPGHPDRVEPGALPPHRRPHHLDPRPRRRLAEPLRQRRAAARARHRQGVRVHQHPHHLQRLLRRPALRHVEDPAAACPPADPAQRDPGAVRHHRERLRQR